MLRWKSKLFLATAVTIVGSVILKTTLDDRSNPFICLFRDMNAMSTVHHQFTTNHHGLPPPQVPLDVENYPVAPPELSLEQVHVFVRHGERTPVGIRMSGPPASIPEHWMMCKSHRRFWDAVDHTLIEGTRHNSRHPGGGGFLGGDERHHHLRTTVERGDSTIADGECLLGELTDTGKNSTYNYGRALRQLYIDRLRLLPDTIKHPGEAYFRSTNVPRTIESLQQVIHGLYPMSKRDGVQLRLLIRNGKDENLIGNTFACKRLEVLLVRFAQAAASAHNHILEALDKKVSKYLNGNPIRVDGKPRASGILDTIRASTAHGIKIPAEFNDPSVIGPIEQAVVNEWYADKTEEVRRLGMGRMLDEMTRKMLNKVDKGNEDPLKILVHSTHDTAIAALCSTLDVFEEKWPAFTSSITFELFKKQESQSSAQPQSYLQSVVGAVSPFTSRPRSMDYFIRMRYQNKDMHLPICSAEGNHLTGSPEFCTLDAFRARVKELTPDDWEAECLVGR